MHYPSIAAGALQLAGQNQSDRGIKAAIFWTVIVAVVALIIFGIQRVSRAHARRTQERGQ